MAKKTKMYKRRAPRRRRAAGKMSNNTKVDQKVTYRNVLDLTTSASTTGVGTYVYNNFSPQNGSFYSISQNPEFLVQAKLFDEFKITSMTVQYRPYANTVLPNNGSSVLQPQLYTIVDRDGQVPISSSTSVPAKLMTYDSLKTTTFYKKMSRTVKLKSFWTDCSAPTVVPQSVNGTAQPWVIAGCCQSIVWYGEKLPFGTGTALGQLEVIWRVQFRGKKPAEFTYDALSGSVIVTPITSYTALAVGNPPQSTADVLGGARMIVEDGVIKIKSNITNEQAVDT